MYQNRNSRMNTSSLHLTTRGGGLITVYCEAEAWPGWFSGLIVCENEMQDIKQRADQLLG